MIRKTSLLRTVPTACGQAADIARKPARNGANLHRRPVWNGFCARRLRIDRDLHRERILGAILPLHDIRYHAHAFSLAACWRLRNDFSANEPASPGGFFGTSSPTGGARRDRTDDLLLAKQALSQLSYGPVRGQTTQARGQTFRRLSSDVCRQMNGGPGKT